MKYPIKAGRIKVQEVQPITQLAQHQWELLTRWDERQRITGHRAASHL